EAFLRSLENRGRQRRYPMRDTFQQVFAHSGAQLQVARQSVDELDQGRVQERSPDLEPVHHARPVDLHEDVVSEIKALEISQRGVHVVTGTLANRAVKLRL